MLGVFSGLFGSSRVFSGVFLGLFGSFRVFSGLFGINKCVFSGLLGINKCVFSGLFRSCRIKSVNRNCDRGVVRKARGMAEQKL